MSNANHSVKVVLLLNIKYLNYLFKHYVKYLKLCVVTAKSLVRKHRLNTKRETTKRQINYFYLNGENSAIEIAIAGINSDYALGTGTLQF